METFHKLNITKDSNRFIQEAHGLNILNKTIIETKNKYIKVPNVIHVNEHVLILGKIHMRESTRDLSRDLGIGLALLHKNFNHMYGFEKDNYIGLTKQENVFCKNWGDFFVHYRLYKQINLIKDQKIKDKFTKILKNSEKNIIEFLSNSCKHASLVHGNLWGGNILYSKTDVYLIEPAIYYGDREVDIAMTRMFISGFDDIFYKYYEKTFPLNKEYNKKEVIYNLYHYLNHYNMYGNDYLNHCIEGFTFLKTFND